VILRTYQAVFESVTCILPGTAPAFLFWPGLGLSPLSITVLLLLSATNGPALAKSDWGSVATAIADVFRNNGISVGRNLAKILKIFEEIDEAKSRGLFKGPSRLMS
jgi:hypothetical protein